MKGKDSVTGLFSTFTQISSPFYLALTIPAYPTPEVI
jgi:hypothetical protein